MTALDTNPALVIGLQCAVQLHIVELGQLDPASRHLRCRRWAAEAAVDPIASRGDALQYGSKKPGEAAKVFNALAKGLAAGAFQPGGITFAGQHWCTDHAACLDAEQAAAEGRPWVDPNPDEPTYGLRPLTAIRPAREYL